jgi:hypothetical protein
MSLIQYHLLFLLLFANASVSTTGSDVCPSRDTQSDIQCKSNHSTISTDDGGWDVPHNLTDLSGPCNILKINWTLTQEDFLSKFAYSQPIILTHIPQQSVIIILLFT